MSFNDKVKMPQKKDTNSSNSKQSSQIPLSNYKNIIQRIRMYPQSMIHADAMVLQKTIGNQAVGRLMQETSLWNSKPIQREALPKEEGEVLQGRFGTIQRREIPEEEEELVQMKKENKTGLPDDLKAGVENLSGLSMDDVRVHYNSDRPTQVGALAYTQGTDIHVAPGEEKHLPHETWHVVQQAQGRVQPTTQFMDVAVNDDVQLEREASYMGKFASDFRKDKNIKSQYNSLKSLNYNSNVVIQPKWIDIEGEYYIWHEAIEGVWWYYKKDRSGKMKWRREETPFSEDKTREEWIKLINKGDPYIDRNVDTGIIPPLRIANIASGTAPGGLMKQPQEDIVNFDIGQMLLSDVLGKDQAIAVEKLKGIAAKLVHSDQGEIDSLKPEGLKKFITSRNLIQIKELLQKLQVEIPASINGSKLELADFDECLSYVQQKKVQFDCVYLINCFPVDPLEGKNIDILSQLIKSGGSLILIAEHTGPTFNSLITLEEKRKIKKLPINQELFDTISRCCKRSALENYHIAKYFKLHDIEVQLKEAIMQGDEHTKDLETRHTMQGGERTEIVNSIHVRTVFKRK